ncbi:MAG: hypothetical protein JSU72_20645 [Deltaproteobacteria bacterium]|nr:MAG: hypothetical protein JSU72_20645 [Deltaproteobacteria bacterium]
MGMETLKLEIDGKQVTASQGVTVLQRTAGTRIVGGAISHRTLRRNY